MRAVNSGRRPSQDGTRPSQEYPADPQQAARDEESKVPPLSEDARLSLAIVAANRANREALQQGEPECLSPWAPQGSTHGLPGFGDPLLRPSDKLVPATLA